MNTGDKVIYNGNEAQILEVTKLNGEVVKVLVMYWKQKTSQWKRVWVEVSEVTR